MYVSSGVSLWLYLAPPSVARTETLTQGFRFRLRFRPSLLRPLHKILGNDAFRALAYRRPTYISEDSFDHGGDGKGKSEFE